MLQWTTLHAREYGRVEQRRHFANHALLGGLAPWVVEVLAQQNDTAAWTTESLVGGRSNDVGIFQRIVEQSGNNQTCWVSHVNHQQCSHLVGDGTHTGVIPVAAICAGTTDDEFWLFAKSHFFHHIIVNETVAFSHIIFAVVEHHTREIHWATMREVSAHCEVEAHKLVARFQASQEHCHIGLCARVRLHIGIFSTEQFFDALDSNVFALVNALATAVIAMARIAFGILVGEATAHSFHHLRANEVFTCNQFHTFVLALIFLLDNVEDFVVLVHSLNCVICYVLGLILFFFFCTLQPNLPKRSPSV